MRHPACVRSSFLSRAHSPISSKLPSLIDDTIGGVSALGFGAITAYYGFPSALGAIERRLPRWRGARAHMATCHWPAKMSFALSRSAGTVIPPLIAAVPAGLGVAFTAAVGRTLVPGLVELGLQVFFGTSGAIFGATVDAKRHLAASQLRRASPSPPSSST